jgi:hypothetical protein
MAYPSALIFYLLTNRKCDFCEVQKDGSRGPLAIFIHFLPFTLPKMLLGCSKEIDDSGGPPTQQSIFGLLGV